MTRCGVALAWCVALCAARPAAAEDIAATVSQAQGQAFATPPGGAERPLGVGQSLAVGTQVRTGGDGSATLSLVSNQGTLTIRAGSHLALGVTRRREAAVSQAVVLFIGRVWSRISPALGDAPRFEVSTPTAVAGVRGTAFETGVGADGSTRVQVVEGTVQVGDEHRSVSVGAGQEAIVDEHGVGAAHKSPARFDWGNWQRERGHRLSGVGGRTMAQQLSQRVTASQQALQQLSTQRDQLVAQRAAATDPGKATSLDNELRTLQLQASSAADHAAAQVGLATAILSNGRAMGLSIPPATVASLRKTQQAGGNVAGLAAQATAPAPVAPPPEILTPEQEATNRLGQLESKLRGYEAAAVSQNDSIKVNCVRDVLGQFNAVQSVAMSAMNESHAATIRGDAVAKSQIQGRIKTLMTRCEAYDQRAAACRGGGPTKAHATAPPAAAVTAPSDGGSLGDVKLLATSNGGKTESSFEDSVEGNTPPNLSPLLSGAGQTIPIERPPAASPYQ